MDSSDIKVIVYSAPWCAFCKMTKDYLNKLGVNFTEVDVEQDRQAALDLVQKTGQAGIPVIEIGERIIIGFDRPTIDTVLKEYGLV